jgi:hypothetical protein
MSDSENVYATGAKRHDLHTFTVDQLVRMRQSIGTPLATPYPEQWLEEELRLRRQQAASSDSGEPSKSWMEWHLNVIRAAAVLGKTIEDVLEMRVVDVARVLRGEAASDAGSRR